MHGIDAAVHLTARGHCEVDEVRLGTPDSRRLLAVAAACAALVSAELEAQSGARQDRSPAGAAWRFATSPALDLWFHGLALIGFDGFGTAPLYDPGYAARVRDEKAATRTAVSRLQSDAARFREAFEQDSAFEVLHFIPLALPLRDPASLIRVLRSVARGRLADASADPGVRAVTQALAAALPEPAQRKALGDFLDAIEEEWRTWLRVRLEAGAAEGAARAARAQEAWNARVQPELAGWLKAGALDGGMVLLTATLGSEGRFSEGDPSNPSDNLAVVRDAAEADVIVAVLREICYPAVRRAIARAGASFPDRVTATRISDLAATRCGAWLAARVAADIAVRYEERFRAVAPDHGGYTLPPSIEAALKEELSRGG